VAELYSIVLLCDGMGGRMGMHVGGEYIYGEL